MKQFCNGCKQYKANAKLYIVNLKALRYCDMCKSDKTGLVLALPKKVSKS